MIYIYNAIIINQWWNIEKILIIIREDEYDISKIYRLKILENIGKYWWYIDDFLYIDNTSKKSILDEKKNY